VFDLQPACGSHVDTHRCLLVDRLSHVIRNRVHLTELDAKWTGMWQQSSEAAVMLQSEVSRMGGMVSEASAAATSAAQQVAALAEAILPLQQRLAAVEQQHQEQLAAETAGAARSSVPSVGNHEEAAPAAPAAAASALPAGDHQEQDTTDGSLVGRKQLARLERRLLAQLQRKLAANGGRSEHLPFRTVGCRAVTMLHEGYSVWLPLKHCHIAQRRRPAALPAAATPRHGVQGAAPAAQYGTKR
jgi:hypothetical protein